MKSLADLPHFEVLEFLPTTRFGVFGFLGRFNQTQDVSECPCWLRISADVCSRGQLHALRQSDRTGIFIPSVGREYIQLGMSLPWIEAYWKRNDIEMVIDPSWPWERLVFKPKDGWRIDADVVSATLVRAPDNAAVVPEGVTVISGGWDHEHCRFCWKKIGVGGAAEGFIDSQGTWLCEACFKAYVLQHDLSFMEVHGKTWPDSIPEGPHRRVLRFLKRGFARR